MAAGPLLHVGRLSFPLQAGTALIGRSPRQGSPGAAADIDLGPLDGRQAVSRLHALLERRTGAVWLRDLDSRNGTLVNDRILLRGTVIRLRDADRISFAGIEAVFQEEGQWPPGLTVGRPPVQRPTPADDVTLPGPRRRT